MESFEKFEDIEAWKSARKLTNRIYEFSKRGQFTKDRGLKNQIRRASVSIMSNIAEGFERNSNKEFIQYLFTARGSAAEVRSQLYVAHDESYIDDDEFQECRQQIESIAGMLTNLIKYLES